MFRGFYDKRILTRLRHVHQRKFHRLSRVSFKEPLTSSRQPLRHHYVRRPVILSCACNSCKLATRDSCLVYYVGEVLFGPLSPVTFYRQSQFFVCLLTCKTSFLVDYLKIWYESLHTVRVEILVHIRPTCLMGCSRTNFTC